MAVFRCMQMLLIGNEKQKAEFGDLDPNIGWISEGETIPANPGLLADLLFDGTPARVQMLQASGAAAIAVNSVVQTMAGLPQGFARINGWNGFLQGKYVEASCTDTIVRSSVEAGFALTGKQVEWLPDEPGFVTPRVISMLVNEAYFALSEKVSTREEIDTALKLGTAYPYGPFEWSNLIGLKNIAALLQELSVKEPRYNPCPLLLEEANAL